MKKLLLCAVFIAFTSLCQAAPEETSNETSTVSATVATPGENQFLNWEHTLTTRTSQAKYPVAKFKIYNNWTPSQHRFLVKYNVLGLGSQANILSRRYGSAFSMPDFDPARLLNQVASYHHGTLGIVERLNDDKIIAFSSEAGAYFIEPRKALFKRVRLDPWKKLAPELSKEDPPALTPEQRRRLGREVRSVVRPILRDVFRSYFRALPETRTFNVAGELIPARGYRMTMLFNAGGRYEGEKWVRVNAEWWLAPSMPGDEVLQTYGTRYITDLNELHGLTTSMWINEMMPVLWEMMPQAMHQAVATFMPTGLPLGVTGDNAFRTTGAPVYAALTLAPPPTQRYAKCPKCGEMHVAVPGQTVSNTVRVEVQLNKRDTRTLDKQVFAAPPEYKKESLQPILKEWDEGMEMLQSLFDNEVRLSDRSVTQNGRLARADTSTRCDASTLNATSALQPEYSWSAMKEYLRAVGRFAH
jgi:hypothetical protein